MLHTFAPLFRRAACVAVPPPVAPTIGMDADYYFRSVASFYFSARCRIGESGTQARATSEDLRATGCSIR